MPKNSSPYRKPPLKRTRDSFVDDRNSEQNPRIDLGQARHTQVRRDKDTTRSLGITLYDIDFAVKSYIDQTMQLKVEDNGETITVPTLYANSEKWISIQRDGYLKDKKGKTMVPLLTFRRSNVALKNELRRNKVATTNQISYVMQQKYSKSAPYDRFSSLYGTKVPQEYFVTPMPDYVDVTYDFIVWTEYQSQLNYLVENFVYFGGKSFGDKNFFRFATNIENFAMEDMNTTGQDRMVRANFSITVHGYLLPKEIANEVTTKRVITPNKVTFVSEVFRDVITPFTENDRLYNSENFKSLNRNEQERLDDLQRRLNDFDEESLNRSPDVYPTELD
jgi:hypothetical protein